MDLVYDAPDKTLKTRLAAGLLLVITLLAGCQESQPATRTTTPSADPSSSPNGGLQVIPVNYEVVAGSETRFLVGLLLPDNRFVAYGKVQMRFTPLDASGEPAGETTDIFEGSYLPVPGTSPGGGSQANPVATTPSKARGAYELRGPRFLQPGPWAVEVAAKVEGAGVVQGLAQFEVLAEPHVPGIGEEAPASDNPVIADEEVPPVAIDSRANNGASIPDPELHGVSVADAIRSGRPAVVLFSTPVYCVSRFCGPVTDVVQELALQYKGRAEFIHIEVWRDFQANVANDAATEWLYRDDELTEPWLFVIDKNGKIVARWDNLFGAAEVTAVLNKVL